MGKAIEVGWGKVMGKVVGEVREVLDERVWLPDGGGYSPRVEPALDEVHRLGWARPL